MLPPFLQFALVLVWISSKRIGQNYFTDVSSRFAAVSSSVRRFALLISKLEEVSLVNERGQHNTCDVGNSLDGVLWH
jgi:hypothetical protein